MILLLLDEREVDLCSFSKKVKSLPPVASCVEHFDSTSKALTDALRELFMTTTTRRRRRPPALGGLWFLLTLLQCGCRHEALAFRTTPKQPPPRPGSIEDAVAQLGRVPYGEQSRQYRRTVYSHSDWIRHRNNPAGGSRIFANIRGMFFSGIIRQMRGDIAVVTAVATFVVLWNDYIVPYSEAHATLMNLPDLDLPLSAFTLSSPALGLLLVFRTNASYQRWLEARARWSVVETHTRNCVRMAVTFCPNAQDKDDDDATYQCLLQLAAASWLVARTMMNVLAGPAADDEAYQSELMEYYRPYNADLVDFLLVSNDKNNNDGNTSQMMQQDQRAQVALLQLSLALDRIPVDEKRRVEIDKSIILIADAVAACQRILTSPVPLVYTKHSSRFLSLWMLLLPFAMHDQFMQRHQTGLVTIPAAALLSLFLFGIEELAIQLEEPFSILPMQEMCDDIRVDTAALVEWSVKLRHQSSQPSRRTGVDETPNNLHQSSSSLQSASKVSLPPPLPHNGMSSPPQAWFDKTKNNNYDHPPPSLPNNGNRSPQPQQRQQVVFELYSPPPNRRMKNNGYQNEQDYSNNINGWTYMEGDDSS